MKNLNSIDELLDSLFNKYNPKEIPDLYNIYKDMVDSFHDLLLESTDSIWKVFNAKLKIAAVANMIVALLGVLIGNRTFLIIITVALIISLVLKTYKYFKIKFLVRKGIIEFSLATADALSITINNYMQSNGYCNGTVCQEDLDQLNELASKCAEYSISIMKGLNNER